MSIEVNTSFRGRVNKTLYGYWKMQTEEECLIRDDGRRMLIVSRTIHRSNQCIPEELDNVFSLTYKKRASDILRSRGDGEQLMHCNHPRSDRWDSHLKIFLHSVSKSFYPSPCRPIRSSK